MFSSQETKTSASLGKVTTALRFSDVNGKKEFQTDDF